MICSHSTIRSDFRGHLISGNWEDVLRELNFVRIFRTLRHKNKNVNWRSVSHILILIIIGILPHDNWNRTIETISKTKPNLIDMFVWDKVQRLRMSLHVFSHITESNRKYPEINRCVRELTSFLEVLRLIPFPHLLLCGASLIPWKAIPPRRSGVKYIPGSQEIKGPSW